MLSQNTSYTETNIQLYKIQIWGNIKLTKEKKYEIGHVALLGCYMSIIAYAILFIFNNIVDSDAFFLIQNGKDIVETGGVPQTLLRTVHGELPTIIQQWIVSLINYVLYSKVGFSAFSFYGVAMYFADLFIIDRFIKMQRLSTDVRILINCAVAFVIMPFANTRPTILTIFVVTLELIVLTKYNRSSNNKLALLLPVLAFIEVNIHAALWLLIPIFAIPYIFPIKNRAEKSISLIVSILAMVPASVINPNKLDGALYLLKSYSSANSGLAISELTRTIFASTISLGLWGSIGLIAIYLYKYRTIRHEDLAPLFLACGTIILGVLHARDVWMPLLGMIPLAGITLDDILVFDYSSHNKRKKRLNLFVATIVSTVLLLTSYSRVINGVELKDNDRQPLDAIAYLEKENNGNKDFDIFTEFGNGAFMKLNGYRVYIDARPELYQKAVNGKKDIYTEYCDVYTGTTDYQNFIDSYNFKYFLVVDADKLSTYLDTNPNYETLVDGNGYKLFGEVASQKKVNS